MHGRLEPTSCPGKPCHQTASRWAPEPGPTAMCHRAPAPRDWLLDHDLPRLERLPTDRKAREEHAALRGAAIVEAVPAGAEHAGGRVLVDQRAHRAALHVVDAERHARRTGERVL